MVMNIALHAIQVFRFVRKPCSIFPSLLYNKIKWFIIPLVEDEERWGNLHSSVNVVELAKKIRHLKYEKE